MKTLKYVFNLFGIRGDYRDSATPSIQNSFIGKIVYARLYNGVLSESDITIVR